MSPRPSGLGEAAARDVLLLQAFESIDPPSPSWTAADAAWATRAAREADVSGSTAPEAFLAARAALALARLWPREPALAAAWPPTIASGRRLGLAAVAAGFVTGIAADAIGSSQRINLLAPPLWTVVVWNLVVYALLIAAASRRALGGTPRRPGGIARLVRRAVGRAGRLPGAGTVASLPGPTAAALRVFAVRWSALAGPLAVARAVPLLHAAAAALGAGLVAGLYARGLVLDFRVAWESTFLSAADVHAALSTLLAPASRLSGIALPDVASVAALRAAHADAAVGAPAAPWIHLYAWTLAIAVVVPRTVLAAAGAARVRRSAAHVRLPLDDAYFRRLASERRGAAARVCLCPYAQTPAATAIAGVRSLLAAGLGDGLTFEVAPTTPFGGEDEQGSATVPAAATLVVALFDLGATPEPEHQGRFLVALAARSAGAATIACIDETAFRRRFGHDGPRAEQRRDAWRGLLATCGTVPVFVPLDAPGGVDAVARLRAALASPVGPPR